MYIDTEGTFRPERLLAVAERSVLICQKQTNANWRKEGIYSQWDNLKSAWLFQFIGLLQLELSLKTNVGEKKKKEKQNKLSCVGSVCLPRCTLDHFISCIL